MPTYHATIDLTAEAKSEKKVTKLLDRMLDAAGDAVTSWEPTVDKEAAGDE